MSNDQPSTRQEKGKGKKPLPKSPYGQKRVRQVQALLEKALLKRDTEKASKPNTNKYELWVPQSHH